MSTLVLSGSRTWIVWYPNFHVLCRWDRQYQQRYDKYLDFRTGLIVNIKDVKMAAKCRNVPCIYDQTGITQEMNTHPTLGRISKLIFSLHRGMLSASADAMMPFIMGNISARDLSRSCDAYVFVSD